MRRLWNPARGAARLAVPPSVPSAPVRLVLLAVAFAPATSFAADAAVTWSNPTPTGAETRALAVDSDTGKIHAVGLSGALVTSEDDGLTWTDRTRPAVNDVAMRAIAVVAAEHLVAVGDAPGVLQSLDGGDTWDLDPLPGVTGLADVDLTPWGMITAVGEGGVLVRSADQGMTWTVTSIAADDLSGIGWRTATNGYAVTASAVFETTDEGDTWTERTELAGLHFPSDVEWHDPEHGFILDIGGYRESTDAGATWTDQGSTSGEPTYVATLVRIDADTWIAPQNGDGAFLFRTTDAGLSWTLVDARDWAGGFFDAVRTPTGAIVACTRMGDLLRSDDDGLTWTNTVATPADGVRVTFGAIAARPDGTLLASGRTIDSRVVAVGSDDGGASWEIGLSPGTWIRALTFGTDQVGYAGGDEDVIQRTDDGGRTWTETPLTHPLGSGYRAATIVALGDQVAYAGGFGPGTGGIFRTLDGGATWSFQSTGIPAGAAVSTISFVDGAQGYAAVYHGGPRLYATTHGSDVWALVPATGLPGVIQDMVWRSDTEAIAVCQLQSDGGIVRTTDAGHSWTLVHPRPCDRLVARADGALVALPHHGDGLLVSEDGGLTWTDLILPVPGPMACAVASGPDVLVAGDASRILRVADLDVVGVAVATLPFGTGRLRARVPVGPRPTLEVAGVRGRANVDLFDVAGRNVARLVGTPDASARATLAWTGTDHHGRALAAGVYLARLRGAAGPGVRLVLNR